MYGIFTYIYHKNQLNVGDVYHTWMVWVLSLQEVIPFSGEMELGVRNLFLVTLARLGKHSPTENQNLPGKHYCW